MRRLIQWLISLAAFVAYRSYQAEGLNALFLLLPAKFVVPVLTEHGAIIGSGAELHTPLMFHNVSAKKGLHYLNLKIGSDCYVGRDVFFDLADQVLIENEVTISMRVTVLTHTHAGKSPLSIGHLKPVYAPVHLRSGCYLGAGAIILPGVTVGEQAVVGAGAVVTKDVPAGSVVAGSPAHELRYE